MKIENAIEILKVSRDGGTVSTQEFTASIGLGIAALERILEQRAYTNLATLFPSSIQKVLTGEDKSLPEER